MPLPPEAEQEEKKEAKGEKEDEQERETRVALYNFYIASKYGRNEDEEYVRQQIRVLRDIYSLLVWALRKMGSLWSRKAAQSRLKRALKEYGFASDDIIRISMRGNAMTDEAAIQLIEDRFALCCVCSLRRTAHGRTFGLLECSQFPARGCQPTPK